MKIAQNINLSNDLKISRVVTGLWQVADMEKDGQVLDPISTSSAMEPYVRAGFTTFDMADHYGSAEKIAGTFRQLRPLGKSIQCLTKWVPAPGRSSKAEAKAAIVSALKQLNTDCIDLLQFHAWSYSDLIWLDQLNWLSELKNEGYIQNLGLTNFDADHLRIVCASGIPVLTNQVSYSMIDQRAGGEMTQVCRQFGVHLLAYGCLAGGFLTERWLDKPEPIDNDRFTWSQMKYKRFIDSMGGWKCFQELLKELNKIANKYQVSIANIVCKYILELECVAAIIIGAHLGQSEHISDTLRLFALKISDEDMLLLKNIHRGLIPIPGDCGDEYRKPPFLTASGDLSHHFDAMPPAYQTESSTNQTTKVFSGTSWEDTAGYCRALKRGNRILVSGTTATHHNHLVGGIDPAAQMHFIIDKIEGVIKSLGGSLENIIRTRIFVHNVEDWEAVARAHGRRFYNIQPVNTLVEAKLVGEGYLVEMEAEAEL
ncbi:MAG TPA: aldo/keto reductase [Saprospiraceae bacterium]|nr:aldo/keto reductase [Saprospiraceae bacterium]